MESTSRATAGAATTGRTRWKLDGDHSQIGFSVRHMMFATVKGRFGGYTADVELDPADPAASRVQVRVDASSIDTGVAARDTHLRSADFFDVENHPELVFESRRVERKAAGRYVLTGDLTLRGVTREVVLEVEERGSGTDPWGGRRVAYVLTGTLDRTAYGLTWNQALEAGGVLVSTEVKLDIEVQLVEAA